MTCGSPGLAVRRRLTIKLNAVDGGRGATFVPSEPKHVPPPPIPYPSPGAAQPYTTRPRSSSNVRGAATPIPSATCSPRSSRTTALGTTSRATEPFATSTWTRRSYAPARSASVPAGAVRWEAATWYARGASCWRRRSTRATGCSPAVRSPAPPTTASRRSCPGPVSPVMMPSSSGSGRRAPTCSHSCRAARPRWPRTLRARRGRGRLRGRGHHAAPRVLRGAAASNRHPRRSPPGTSAW